MKMIAMNLALALVLAASTALTAIGGETNVLETLRPSVKRAVSEFNQINPERRNELKEAAAFISEQKAKGNSAELTFICTHNSRRSHMSQLWAQTAAAYYGLPEVKTYSGGTEVAACNYRTVNALRRAGFSIVQSTTGTNPVYLAQFSESAPPVKLYSKLFEAKENPQRGFAAIFTCDKAAASCPFVPHAERRLPIMYEDPKVSDGTPAESAAYDERSRQIAREMFYMMSQVQ
jgi:hypothetical protein